MLEHNRGGCPNTSKHRPWQIETAIAFKSNSKALAANQIARGRLDRCHLVDLANLARLGREALA